MTYFDLYDQGRIKLFKLKDGENDARLLLLWAFGIDMNELLLDYTAKQVDDDEAGKAKTAKYECAIERRASGVPLQHITHESNFFGLKLYVDENVLVPRFDTEVLVETVLNDEEQMQTRCSNADASESRQPSPRTALDMCTGSGCIAIALAKYGSFERVDGSDISRAALEIADANAGENGVEINFYESDMFSELGGLTYDVIVSNPPYIKTRVIETLMPEVRDHDPRMALDGDEDGLKFYRILAKEAPKHLKSGGRLYLEIGYDQADEVSGLLEENGFRDIKVIKDLSQLDRVLCSTI